MDTKKNNKKDERQRQATTLLFALLTGMKHNNVKGGVESELRMKKREKTFDFCDEMMEHVPNCISNISYANT
jgi:hypothetical protein